MFPRLPSAERSSLVVCGRRGNPPKKKEKTRSPAALVAQLGSRLLNEKRNKMDRAIWIIRHGERIDNVDPSWLETAERPWYNRNEKTPF